MVERGVELFKGMAWRVFQNGLNFYSVDCPCYQSIDYFLGDVHRHALIMLVIDVYR